MVWSWNVHVGVKFTKYKVQKFLSAKTSGDVLGWIKKSPPKSFFKKLFLETRSLLVPITSMSTKNLLEGLKDLECKRGTS